MTLQPGKLPASLLAELLSRVPHRDQRVFVGPGIGRDAAVIEFGGKMLIAKTDPVTFASRRIGASAVHVNANDIACMGGRPAWFLATALLPPGGPETLASEIFDDIIAACDELGIELVGGHTEVTIGIDRPIIAGMMLGEADRDDIADRDIQIGDAVLMTKAIAIEGTALLAIESPEVLLARGVPAPTIEACGQLFASPGISVLPDANLVMQATRPRIMHDPTEGGLATGLAEMAHAAGRTLRIDARAIAVLDETRLVCGRLELDPMGLLASGTLLAIVPAADCERVKQAFGVAEIDCEIIGRVEEGAPEVILVSENQAAPLPVFARDEIARFYDELQHAEG
jgi:hydrogenase maturation factor